MRRSRRPNAALVGAATIFLFGAALASGAFAGTVASQAAVGPLAGSQGIDTALPLTPSAVTVNGRGTFSTLALTVNQTKSLTNQAVSITWTGGTPTVATPNPIGAQYLQIMQCWGDDDGTNPDNPGPPPEQCVQGAVAGNPGGLPSGTPYVLGGRELSRIAYQCQSLGGPTGCLDAGFDPSAGVLDASGNQWVPFRAVDGTEVDFQSDSKFNPSLGGGNFWLNPYFNIITTNEIAGGRTGPDGTGAELMQLLTGVQSSGLGCGQSVQPLPTSGTKVPRCWIVVVPRGSAVDEDLGVPGITDAVLANQAGVVTSPLNMRAWANRIAIPLEFNPVESPCALGQDERRISGSELALTAIASWQPALCTGAALPPFSFAPIADGSARRQLASRAPGGPGLITVAQPLATDASPDKVVYAPLTLSGVTIGFNIERNPSNDAPADEKLLAGVRVANMQLTPRLVAKLLTQSYSAAVSIIGSSPKPTDSYTWMANNPRHLAVDPDFLRFNPEFSQLQVQDARTFSTLQLPAGNSDAAQLVWEWILADPEAKAFLDGVPDENGMKVNPLYSTDPTVNPSGIAFGVPAPNSFPKSDPYCFQALNVGAGGTVVPPALCGTDYVPYTRGFADGAAIVRAAADGARIDANNDALAPSQAWSRTLPQFPGRRAMLALTDTPSAAQFGLQAAALSRAGDDASSRTFVAPTNAALELGAAAMSPKTEPQVVEPDPTVSAPGAYPLTTVIYAAVRPLALSAAERSDFAAFLEYALTKGQVPGLDPGQLPRGYAPLTAALTADAIGAKDLVRTLQPSPTTTTTAAAAVASRPPRGVSNGGGTPVVEPASSDVPTTTVTSSTTTSPTVASTTSPPSTTNAVITPGVSASSSRFAVPGLGFMALGSALGALEITKRPRRRSKDVADADETTTKENN